MLKDPYLESRIMTGDPVELIQILYEHVVTQVKIARAALRCGDIAGRFGAVSKALAGIGELEGSLDFENGGSISQSLARLYPYMRKELTDGNFRRDDAAMARVESLMETLQEGWRAMRNARCAPAMMQYSQATVESDVHSWSA